MRPAPRKLIARLRLITSRQILSAAVVLGLSAKLAVDWHEYDKACGTLPHKEIKECRQFEGRWPSSTDFSAFVGAWGLLDALVGLVAVFVTALPLIAILVLDGLAAVFYLAGGVVSHNCCRQMRYDECH